MEKHSRAQKVARQQNRLCSFLGSRLIGFSQQYDSIGGGLEGEKVKEQLSEQRGLGVGGGKFRWKDGSFWSIFPFFFLSLLCFLPPSFYIPFVLPFSLLTSHVIASDRSALFVQCPNNKGSQLERDLATIEIHTTTKGRCSTPFHCTAKPTVNQIIYFYYTLPSGKLLLVLRLISSLTHLLSTVHL